MYNPVPKSDTVAMKILVILFLSENFEQTTFYLEAFVYFCTVLHNICRNEEFVS